MEVVTRMMCQVSANMPNQDSPCGNDYVNNTKATFLDCQAPSASSTSQEEDFDYFLCTDFQQGGVSQCSHCNSSSTMLNMTLRFLPFGDTAVLSNEEEDSFLWTRLPKVFKSVSCSVGGLMDMFMDCADPNSVNVTSEELQEFNSSTFAEKLSLWDGGEWNTNSSFRGAIGEYVQCTLQSVVMNAESTTPTSDLSDVSQWGTRHHDWSFLFVLVFIVAGGVGNILVCLAVCLDRRLQNVTNYFLLSLAIADLLVSLFVMPLGAIPGFLGEEQICINHLNHIITFLFHNDFTEVAREEKYTYT